jgi:aryl-alcohol dehydrogenase-like predicted oxidoreductase
MKKRKLGGTNMEVSEIGLGTTEIGYVYGIGPRELPTDEEAIEFLKKVVALGINFIDTGAFYGLAEDRIGKSGIAKIPGVIVSTKCGHFLDKGEDMSDDELYTLMRTDVLNSLKKLDLKKLPLVLVHGGSAEQIKKGGIIKAMQKIKDEGLVGYVGISTRGFDAPLAAIESGFFDVLQVAYSILDQRIAEKILVEADKKNIGIINRSVLLKGVLSNSAKYLNEAMKPLKDNTEKVRMIAEELGIDLPTLAVRFALSNSAVGTVLVGSNKIKHVEEAVEASNQGVLSEEILKRLYELGIDDPMQVDPKNFPDSVVADTKIDGTKIPHPNR